MFSLSSAATDWRQFQFAQSRRRRSSSQYGGTLQRDRTSRGGEVEPTLVFALFLYFGDQTASVLPESSGDSKQEESHSCHSIIILQQTFGEQQVKPD